ncbi:hypothetical protein V8B97DRAFT_2023065 [Scleroderma yunnanense]
MSHSTSRCQTSCPASGHNTGRCPMQLLAEEIKKINVKLSELQIANERLTLCMEDEEVSLTTNKLQQKLASTTKNISNQHPKLKSILHCKVLDMCSIERLGLEDHIHALAECIEGLPNQRPSKDIDSQIIWRPVWSAHIDHTMNLQFLHAVVDSIMEDEKAKCAQGKTELEDNDYIPETVMTMAKSYWHTLATDICSSTDPDMQAKHTVLNTGKHQCTRRGTFEKKYGVQGVTINEEGLSENLKACHKAQDVPSNGWMRAGLTWQSLDYIAFLCILDTIHKQQHLADPESTGSGPPPKHQKTTKKKDNFTWIFDLHPSKMEDKPPHLGKSKPTIPFQMMFNETWLGAHPSQQVMDGMEWLGGFHLWAKEGNLTPNNCTYLDELAEYLAGDLDN